MALIAKPDKIPEFATADVVDPVTGQNNVVEPPALKKTNGWDYLEKPARNWMNWLHRKTYQWIEYFNQFFSATHQFKINEIVEYDTGGVNLEDINFKDNIIKHKSGSGVIIDDSLKINVINEKTTDAGVTIDGSLIKDGIITDDGSDGIGIEEVGGAILRTKIFEIGDWNMSASAIVDIDLGIDVKKIRAVSVIIRKDDDDLYYPIDIDVKGSINQGGGWFFWISTVGATHIRLIRTNNANNGLFENANYDSTSYNRGWITITYID